MLPAGIVRCAVLLAAATLLPAAALAQTADYPSRALRLVVPYPPGGIADILGRVVAQPLGNLYGRPIVVENKTGSGGHVGAEGVANAPADGYTLMLGTIAHNAAYAMYTNLPYDPAKALKPVIVIAESAGVLVVHPSVPAKSVPEFIALAKSKPGGLAYASAGHGSAIHMAAELFMYMTGTQLTHVPYRGSAPAMTDLVSGQVQVMFENIASAHPHIKAGKIRPLAVTSPKRNASLPDLPPIAEVGVPGYDAVPYYTISVASGVPADIVRKLNADLNKVLQQPEVMKRWAELGVAAVGGSVEDAARRNTVETERWTKVIKAAQIKAQ
jgi:tripartite-type tricarboxylate transporter receptor subunit TctC